jgi:hypothetical protein
MFPIFFLKAYSRVFCFADRLVQTRSSLKPTRKAQEQQEYTVKNTSTSSVPCYFYEP